MLGLREAFLFFQRHVFVVVENRVEEEDVRFGRSGAEGITFSVREVQFLNGPANQGTPCQNKPNFYL